MYEQPLIHLRNFILSTRDSGYKNTSSALAEIVDNSLEAKATKVEIHILQEEDKTYQISVRDNGIGMTPKALNVALQFGGSTRYDSRTGMGRFGMGLPNASLSQARKVEVITWTNEKRIYTNSIDVDLIKKGLITFLDKPQKLTKTELKKESRSGTIINWYKCDRLSYKNKKTLISKVATELGRIFRYHIWEGKIISINNIPIKPIDPLMQNDGINLKGGRDYGKELTYNIKIPNRKKATSKVSVKFIELPVDEWFNLPNADKRKWGITKRAGVTILRANREIDYGWFFMGSKRKENYDDWWRCEIKFDPKLDETFGVTHTKQKINPTEFLKKLLSPDLSKIALKLNNRVRQKFQEVKLGQSVFVSKTDVEKKDNLLEPPAFSKLSIKKKKQNLIPKTKETIIKGLEYFLHFSKQHTTKFYEINFSKSHIDIFMNIDHPFFEKVYLPLSEDNLVDNKVLLKKVELMLLSAARAESLVINKSQVKHVEAFRNKWSEILNTFLT